MEYLHAARLQELQRKSALATAGPAKQDMTTQQTAEVEDVNYHHEDVPVLVRLVEADTLEISNSEETLPSTLLGEILLKKQTSVEQVRAIIEEELEERLEELGLASSAANTFEVLTNSRTALLSKQEARRRTLEHCCAGGSLPLLIQRK